MTKFGFQFMKAVLRTFRHAALWARRVDASVKCGGAQLPSDLQIEQGVKIAATDGGRIQFGAFTAVDRFATVIVKHGKLSAGRNLYLGVGSVVVARESITIGENVLIAEHVTIRDQDHAIVPTEGQGRVGFTSSPVVIGDNVWLGAKVTVIQGVTIGNNVVVGANSVVTHDLPDNCVAVGAPARVVRQLKAD
jgi:acetyltransferase-like isoleucine patch superfamily enzyme